MTKLRGYELFNNQTAAKIAVDPQASFGAKKKNDCGYKNHASVDMQSGLIDKAVATPANTPDSKALKNGGPNQGVVYADKAYCSEEVEKELRRRGCHSGIIKKIT